MKSKDIDAVIKLLALHFETVKSPVVDLIQAQTNDPLKVLITTILSARTKDETTTKAVNNLFTKVDKLEDLENLSADELDRLIYQVGFHNEKTKHLKRLPEVLKKEFNGQVPSEIDDLLKLPGVGRKTANLVRVIAFGLPGICVDVHVHRICNRLGYLSTSSPLETEMELRRILPDKYWLVINSYLVAFGQNTCLPRKPLCHICPIIKYCERIGL